VITPDPIRKALRDVMDDKGAKFVAHDAKLDRKTLYRVLAGVSGPKVQRRLSAFLGMSFTTKAPTSPS
jgi:DNA-binding phage protein